MTNAIKLYSLATPNGQKVGIALEEMGFAYEAHTVNILKDEQFEEWFVKINPNSKIPVIIDPKAHYGKDFAVFESGAILLYLAKKTRKFIPDDAFLQNEMMQWLFFQMASIGPMFGQFGHFYKYAKENCDHPYPVERYTKEAKRLLKVLDKRLADNKYLVGEKLTIADFATMPWVVCLDKFYEAGDQLELASYKNVNRWSESLLERPAVQRGMKVCPIPES